ncbi:A24 family peptidase [Peptococcaceae bacterium 1198_IL3148]
MQFGFTLQYLLATLLFSGLLAISLIDYDHQLIPDQINLVLLLAGISLLALQSRAVLVNGLLGALVGFGALFVVAVVSKGGMGGGDVKLAGVLGLYLGWPNILMALFLSFIIGSVIGLTWAAVKQKSLKTALPFGPFLSVAAMLVLLWGQEIISWYWNLF